MFYKWTREKFVRSTPNGRWVPDHDEDEVLYCTEDWMEVKVGRDECAFWRGIGAWVRVHRDRYQGFVTFTNISPDKLEKRFERFEPVRLHGDALNMGVRENESLDWSNEHQRLIPVLMDTDEHLVLGIGEGEYRTNLDIRQMRWV